MCEVLYPYTKRAREAEAFAQIADNNSLNGGMEQLLRAAELVEKGLLSKEEFEILKKKILA